MSLWTVPIVVSGQHPFNAPAFGKVCGILDVNDLNLVNDRVTEVGRMLTMILSGLISEAGR